MEFLENPAVLLIIGAIVGAVPTYLSNRQNNKHAEKMFKLQYDEDYKKDLKIKKEVAYLEFMEFRAIVSQMAEIMQNETYTDEQKTNLSLIQAQNLITGIQNSAKFMPRIALYGNDEVAIKCGEFNVNYQDVEKLDFQQMIDDYEYIIMLMQKDLGIRD